MKIQDFKSRKKAGQKISMLTCYDSTFASLLDETNIDVLLIGDSVAMVQHGQSSTLTATVENIATHTKMVSAGSKNKFIVADMPFLSNRGSLDRAMDAVQSLMSAGAHAVKIEGVAGHEDIIKHIVESGVPVMGHLGLTPQSIHQFGGFKVQGRELKQSEAIVAAAKRLEEIGCFSLVLECVPSPLASEITQQISIPSIGIGAGPDTDGQVLVLQDMLGMNPHFKPKFVRHFLNGADLIQTAVNSYHTAVVEKTYPNLSESYE